MIATTRRFTLCPDCGGERLVEAKPDDWQVCSVCRGNGRILQEGQEDDVAMNIRNIPRTTRERFKAYCTARSIDMQDMVVFLIDRLLQGTASD